MMSDLAPATVPVVTILALALVSATYEEQLRCRDTKFHEFKHLPG